MGFKPFKSKDKNTSSEVSKYSTKTTGPADARAFNGGSGTYAEKGGRAAAASRNGNAWSKSVAYGGDSDDDKRNPYQVSKRQNYTYTYGDATAGVIKGGTYAHAGPGGYAEAAYRDGSRFSASVAYGGEKEDNVWSRHSDLIPLDMSFDQRGMIESYYPSDGEEEDGNNRGYLH